MVRIRYATLYTTVILLALLVIAFINIVYFGSIEFHGDETVFSKVARFEHDAVGKVTNLLHEVEKHKFFTHLEWQEWLAAGIVRDTEGEAGEQVVEVVPEGEIPETHADFAYTTLISGLDETYKYRGFLYNALIMNHALKSLGSTADFIAMVGLNNPETDKHTFKEDLDLLRSHGIIVFFLPRYVDMSADASKNALGFAEMALLKVTPWSFTQYKSVQFLDGDVMPTRNMDCFFQLGRNTYTVGAASPLNSGWYLAVPNMEDYRWLRQAAFDRLHRDWDKVQGWGAPWQPSGATSPNKQMHLRGERKQVKLWDFNSADMDQGLMCHYFILTHGNGVLIDTDTRRARVYERGYFSSGGADSDPELLSAAEALSCCGGRMPTSYFAHFTGKSKPWMNIPPVSQIERFYEPVTRVGGELPPGVFMDRKLAVPKDGLTPDGQRIKPAALNILHWLSHLDALGLPGVNSGTIGVLDLGSPLGFFNAKFPKGGFVKTKEDA